MEPNSARIAVLLAIVHVTQLVAHARLHAALQRCDASCLTCVQAVKPSLPAAWGRGWHQLEGLPIELHLDARLRLDLSRRNEAWVVATRVVML